MLKSEAQNSCEGKLVQVGSANIRQQVSGELFRSVPVATMEGYHDLYHFERDVIVGT